MLFIAENLLTRLTTRLPGVCAGALLMLVCGAAQAHGMRPFNEIDLNNDNAISQEEYLAHSAKRAALAEASFDQPLELAHPFAEMDTNQNGAVSRQEYQDYAKKAMAESNVPVKIGL